MFVENGMATFKRILAVIVMILAAIGALLCLGGVIGAWAANEPVTNAITSTIDTLDGYVGLASQTTQLASDRIGGLRGEIESVQQTAANVTPEQKAQLAERVRATVQQRFGPTVTSVRNAATTLSTGVVALNKSLESLNRLPGVTVPTLTDELQAVNERLDAVNSKVDALGATVSDANFDGARLNAAASAAASELQSLETTMNQWQSRLDAARASAANARSAVSSAIDLGSLVVTLLLLLFGAGQISLFAHALDWFRKP